MMGEVFVFSMEALVTSDHFKQCVEASFARQHAGTYRDYYCEPGTAGMVYPVRARRLTRTWELTATGIAQDLTLALRLAQETRLLRSGRNIPATRRASIHECNLRVPRNSATSP